RPARVVRPAPSDDPGVLLPDVAGRTAAADDAGPLGARVPAGAAAADHARGLLGRFAVQLAGPDRAQVGPGEFVDAPGELDVGVGDAAVGRGVEGEVHRALHGPCVEGGLVLRARQHVGDLAEEGHGLGVAAHRVELVERGTAALPA